MEIIYYTKKVFGREDNYILDPDTASMIEELTGRKVVRNEHKAILEKLGCKFVRVAAPVVE